MSCSAPFDRIAEINFSIDADEDSVSDRGCWAWWAALLRPARQLRLCSVPELGG